MPLPEGNPEWPPPECRAANQLYEKWGAWYLGDPAELARVYGDLIGTGSVVDPKGYAGTGPFGGGLRGFLARMWWGKPVQPGSLQEAKLHVPLAGDIAATSADLLFGEPPALVTESKAKAKAAPKPPKPSTTPDGFPAATGGSDAAPDKAARPVVTDPTQDYLDTLMDSAHAVLVEAAEITAAYGGVYLRVGWDEEIADTPLFHAYHPDTAVPEWRSGHLVAVTFWRALAPLGDGKVYRHLERHEKGRILHGLFAGTDDRLGRPMALGDHPDTETYVGEVDQDGGIDTGYPDGLCAQYIPNMRPNRVLRGSPLGRSDYTGVEPLLDALDEAWTSWMRDLRLGKARLIVPDMYLSSEGRGKGAYFDPEQAIFQAVNALPDAGGSGGLQLAQVQFAIRVVEHQTTCQALATQALRGAGYNAQSFGETGEVAATATEVVARERRSFTTRSRKIRYWSEPLAKLFEAALAIAADRFKAKITVQRPMVEWPDGVAVDPEATARTIQILHAAEAVSTRTRVEMLHPDWDDGQIEAEVEAIGEDKKAELPPMPPPGAGPAGIPTGVRGPAGQLPAKAAMPAKAAPGQAANGPRPR